MAATETPEKVTGFIPPYIAFGTLTDLVERMAKEEPPARIDRSYLDNHSGAYQSQILAALRELALLDPDGAPSAQLKGLVRHNESERKVGVEVLIRQHYAPILALGKNTTQEQFIEAFAKLAPSIKGQTRRKAIQFFLNACKYAEVEVSPYWKVPRPIAPSGAKVRQRPADDNQVDVQDAEESRNGAGDTTLDDARAKYLSMLMERAQTQEELDDKLLDRIEKLLGHQD